MFEIWKWSGVSLGLALVLDVFFGDPAWIYHPVSLMGRWIQFLEKRLYIEKRKHDRASLNRQLYRRGIALWVLTAPVAFVLSALLLLGAAHIHPVLAFVLHTFWCFQLLAGHSLKKESRKVYGRLEAGDLAGARWQVGMLVGRDTTRMDEEQVIRATVETVAENTSDGITAPMLFMFILGAPGGFLYKAVNTLDSMVGYKNERYANFGRCSAKLDDLFNFVPSRLTGLCMVAAAYVSGFDGGGAWRIFCRDRRCHTSPNSAQTESACAGALGLRLGGPSVYFGRRFDKPYIGDEIRRLEAADIWRAGRLMDATWLVLAAVMAAVMALVFLVNGHVLSA